MKKRPTQPATQSTAKTRVWSPRSGVSTQRPPGATVGRGSASRSRGRSGPSPGRGRRPGEKPRRKLTKAQLLEKRREKQEGFGRLYILKQIREQVPMVFETYEGPVVGVPIKRLVYDLDVLVNGEKQRINKLYIKYMYKQKDAEAVRQAIQYDEAIRSQNLQPIRPRKERFQIDTRHLAYARQNKLPIRVVLRGGEVVVGEIDWYSHFEIKVRLINEASVVVFRHAAYDFAVLGARPTS